VEQQQIDEILLAANLQPVLTPDKCKETSHLTEKALNLSCKGFFELTAMTT
jgi:hypothetical protein